MPTAWDLTALLNAADPKASRAERHLWLVRLLEWVRHEGQRLNAEAAAARSEQATPAPVLRLRQLCQVLERHPAHRDAVQGVLAAFAREADLTTLFADFGFAPRASFLSELFQRLRAKLLPDTPDTRSLAELFPLLFEDDDATWVARLDQATGARLGALWPAECWQDIWREAMLQAIAFLCSAVRAAGFGSALRQRMSEAALANGPFMPLAGTAARLRDAVRAADRPVIEREALYLRALLDACALAANSIRDHLEAYGVSLHIVFEADQLLARIARIELLLDAVLAANVAPEAQRLLLALVQQQQQRRSVRALFSRTGTQLARHVAERSAETGEHYITRTREQYREMLRAASGGGAVIALTTFGKFGVAALGLSAFWSGFWAGANYALSFVVIMLLHWTVATKQPAMTAPAIAAKLADIRKTPAAAAQGDERGATGDPGIEAFVDEVAHLIRSQMAGIVGNLALCFPLVLVIQLASGWLFGAPPVGKAEAEYVLHALTLLGPTALFAAFTGVLLFASSLLAGWVENWFVYHRLDSAIEWNPRIVARLGAQRARRWALWWRTHIAGLAANVSLGMMLGLVPVVVSFLGPPLEVRHVTLSTGQLGAALGALGWDLLLQADFWWCVAGIAVTGVLNVGVSFGLAFRVALRAHGVRVQERHRITRAIRRRLMQRPMSFVRPPMFPRESQVRSV